MKKRIVVSDVDGTIVKMSLVLGHAVMLHDEGICDFGTLPARWKADMKNEDLISSLAEAYREQIVGKSTDDLLVDEYIASVVSDESNFYSILGRLERQRDKGNPVVLISGSPSFLVDRFAAHFDFFSEGSEYLVDSAGNFTGKVIGLFNGDAKRKHMNTMKLSKYSQVLAFGDTLSDVPLFEKASYSVLVEPTDETAAALSQTVNEVVFI